MPPPIKIGAARDEERAVLGEEKGNKALMPGRERRGISLLAIAIALTTIYVVSVLVGKSGYDTALGGWSYNIALD